MPRKHSSQADPVEAEIERALDPGTFIPDRACHSFVSDLEMVAARIGKLTGGDPARAVILYETFLAACHLKIEEVDDSSGNFGQFVADLYCGWIKARQAAGADADETAARMLAWMEDDDYGFCYRIENDLVKILDKVHFAAWEKRIRARFDAAAETTAKKKGASSQNAEYLRRRWGEVLRTIYMARKDIDRYIALTDETGLTAQDCHAIATMLSSRRKPQEALIWVERGIDLARKKPFGSMGGYDLAKLKRDLLTRLDRGTDALDDAWTAYRNHPHKYTYDELMKYAPKAEHAHWHAEAMEAAGRTDLQSAMEIFLATQEIDRLADRADRAKDEELEALSHYATEPVAKAFEKTRPDLAARLWSAQGMRIVNAKKSKYYGAALSNFRHARRCFEQAGRQADWQRIVARVRADHHRKIGFMPGFEQLAAGSASDDEPSFLERARTRWNQSLGKTP